MTTQSRCLARASQPPARLPPALHTREGSSPLLTDDLVVLAPRDHGGVILERPDDGMLGEELEWLLPVGMMRDQLSQQPQAIALISEDRFAGSFQFLAGVLRGE